MLDAPPGAGPLQALLGDVAMSAFDLARADRQPVGQSLAVVQVVGASAEIAVAGSHGRMLVVDFGRLATSGKRPQNGVETPAFERLLLRLHPGAARGWVGRDRRRGGAQVFADVIEINQVAALIAELLLDLADDPGRAVADRVNPGVRPEAGANRAGKQLAPGLFDPALDRARINRRAVPLRVRQRQLRLPPGQRFALALVLLLAARLDDRNHAAVRLDDDRLAKARRFRKLQIPTTAFVHRLGVGERDPLDRALADREAVVLLKLGARLREGLIGGEVDYGALQRPRTPERAHFRPEHEWTHPLRPGRVEDWRAGLGRSSCSLLARSFVRECHIISTMPRFQPPPRRTQHADFLALRSPACFAPRLMGPILPERLSGLAAPLGSR